MSVHAFIAPIRTCPEPAILLILHRFDKILAHFVRRRPWIAMFAQHNNSQLFLIPIIHCVIFLVVLLGISSIRVQIFLGGLALYIEVMTEFAFPPLLAVSLFIKYTENCLRVNAKRDFLRLYRFEQFCGLSFRLFSGCFLLFPLEFLCLFLLGVGSLIRCCLCLELGYLFLCRASLFLSFKTKPCVRQTLNTEC